jgi:hypothetical protein
VAAPSNVWKFECKPDEDWGPGVRGERLLERPSGTRLVCAEGMLLALVSRHCGPLPASGSWPRER